MMSSALAVYGSFFLTTALSYALICLGLNLQWGYDNRSCGLRVPLSDGQNRRIENRVPGADANPYLAFAALLAAGLAGKTAGLAARKTGVAEPCGLSARPQEGFPQSTGPRRPSSARG